MTDLTSLIARVEKEGANRPFCVSQDIGEFFKQQPRYEHPGSQNPAYPNYCHSFDAALALVESIYPARLDVNLFRRTNFGGGLVGWTVAMNKGGWLPSDVPRSTPALALILSLLRALADTGDRQEGGRGR